MLLVLVLAGPAAAEEKSHRVGMMLGGGLSFSDVEDAGFIAAASGGLRLARWLWVEAAIRTTAVSSSDTQVAPEIGLQAELHADSWRPYVAAGGGFVVATGAAAPRRPVGFGAAGGRGSLLRPEATVGLEFSF